MNEKHMPNIQNEGKMAIRDIVKFLKLSTTADTRETLLECCKAALLATMAFTGQRSDILSLRTQLEPLYRILAEILSNHLGEAVSSDQLSGVSVMNRISLGCFTIYFKHTTEDEIKPYTLNVLPETDKNLLQHILGIGRPIFEEDLEAAQDALSVL